MHKIALFFPKTAAFHGLRFETKKIKQVSIYQNIRNFFVLQWASLFMAGDGPSALCTSLINFISYRYKLYLFARLTAQRRASPEPCTHTLFNNKVRYMTCFIIILFFYNRDNAEYDCFPASGRRDSLCIVNFFD